jgi:hypothetical protein
MSSTVLVDFSIGGEVGTDRIDALVAAVEAGEVDVNAAKALLKNAISDITDLNRYVPSVAERWQPILRVLHRAVARLLIIRDVQRIRNAVRCRA